MDTQILTKTFDLLEDLARNGAIKVTINKPPKEHATCRLPGVFALVPSVNKNGHSNSADALWSVMYKHGGHTCGNGLGKTKDKQYYWVQSQAKERFNTGEYVWTGQETSNYRQWYSEEIMSQLLDIKIQE